MSWMLVLGKVFTLIPGLMSLGNTFIAKHYDAQVQMYQTRYGTTRDVALEAIRAQAGIAEKWWFVAVGMAIFQWSAGFYFAKAVVWDMALHMGTTDPIVDATLKWSFITVVGGTFAHAAIDKFAGAAK